MHNLVPTETEQKELEYVPTPEDLALAEYEELIRDKRSEADLPCYEWRNNACHCHEVEGSPYKDPIHTERGGKHWCAAHQSVECEESHQYITFEQYKKRIWTTTSQNVGLSV